ncbi:ATP-binding cassette transporter abc2 [Bienertia sinuspersici]
MRNELEADYERKKVELEADYAKKSEEFDKSKDKMVQEVLEKLISKLPINVVTEFLTLFQDIFALYVVCYHNPLFPPFLLP